MKSLPTTLNDGTFDYVLVRQAEQLEDGRENVALYDSVPMNDEYQGKRPNHDPSQTLKHQ